MSDCIFNGTVKRPPMGISEVQLTLVDAELAEAAASEPVPKNARLKDPSQWRYIGKPVRRIALLNHFRDIEHLRAAGIAVEEFSLHLPSLDEVFFTLTGTRSQDNDEKALV